MIPAGNYHLLIHGLKIEGRWCWLHATTLPEGARVKLRLFDTQVPMLIMATMHQFGLPQNLKGGQVKAAVILHPDYGNKVQRFEPLTPEQLLDVKSDVEIDRPLAHASFGV